MRNKVFIGLILLVMASLAQAQKGHIRGLIFDSNTGDYLPGVTVLVEGTNTGTITDLDGNFSLAIKAGTYNLIISYISYSSITISDVFVEANEVTLLDEIGLSEATFELNEIVISAQAVRNTETAMIAMKKKSANVLDGISSSRLRKIGDSDAASSMRRVPGVSVEGGKYVYVRGLGDRYTKTMLNGIDIPGLDPDRNTLQMDIFPTSVVDNLIVHKSFSADLPADFTGGVIDIVSKDFPAEKNASISFSLGYNPKMHFNYNYLTYQGSNTDFLGFDHGARKIPATSNIPFFSQVVGNPYGEKGRRYRQILENFNPIMAAERQMSFMDFSIGANFGNQFTRKKTTYGYNIVFSYKNDTEFYEGAEFGRYGLSGNPDIYKMDVREFQKGDYGINNVLLSGLAGFAIKKINSKYRLNLLHLQNGESKAGIFDYQGSDQGSIFDGLQHNLDYSERSLSNLLLSGEHNMKDGKWKLLWKLSPTYAKMEDPDIRFTRYEDRDGDYHIGTEVGFPERIWRELEEVDIAGAVDLTRELELLGEKAQIQFGGAYTYKNRDYVIRSFALNIRDVPLTGNPNELFFPENLWPLDGNPARGTTYEARFIPTNPNKFDANTNNAAAYISTEMNPFRNFKTILGVRVENYIQRYTGRDQLGNNILDNDKVLDDVDFFPAINLIYKFTEKQNIRFSYSKTIARPSFKELSFAEIYDPITGRTFVGGLFPDRNPVGNIVYWDGNLISTDIHNYDLRWELFGETDQMISFSTFYKEFINPIEIVQYATLVGAFQPRNVGDGEVYGAETEIRYNLKNLTEALTNFRIALNVTLTKSRIKLSKTEYDSRVDNARTGQKVDEYRDMAGQAPYIINGGVSYEGGQHGFWEEFEAGLYYNVQGETLLYAGIVDRPDIYTVPFHSLNFNLNKSFGKNKRYRVGLKIENILNDKKESVFKSYNSRDEFFERLDPGIKFKLSFSYSIF
ncbi:MAG: TonB-dependent receptor [Bacteroidales bacterium]|nr:TonB-dependent receptor [Bacteroidales bacterium]MCF8343390.1 TonB-dependent receptor [Bacteroidales bacterium]MCF8351759.1 TonB-dependent receptor [Bacteroidales bacterium]MCF8377561.1 TonB-dependent receptor [Bacteroidales bacterium]MCF8401708.1 TonB-dependent receptor [Bacteroidales bacterium]